mgnify:CR=1 FL=1
MNFDNCKFPIKRTEKSVVLQASFVTVYNVDSWHYFYAINIEWSYTCSKLAEKKDQWGEGFHVFESERASMINTQERLRSHSSDKRRSVKC